ncbi:unnamed protein product [Vitrella brassicaformis CCMP3155]|uniref:RNA polymerase sigma-70 region 3 domain-containing protein n=2 Tax=Vitrella brassicaformis TaxID=1169539 RepID=A0A0G4EEL2_VITBC|nr:unnamed protein product [Vitrella brassicaformis CCMP3155]|eukprot:CEL93836.1 unnamed protein product [Vitrella brassicaformis CCMP3155]
MDALDQPPPPSLPPVGPCRLVASTLLIFLLTLVAFFRSTGSALICLINGPRGGGRLRLKDLQPRGSARRPPAAQPCKPPSSVALSSSSLLAPPRPVRRLPPDLDGDGGDDGHVAALLPRDVLKAQDVVTVIDEFFATSVAEDKTGSDGLSMVQGPIIELMNGVPSIRRPVDLSGSSPPLAPETLQDTIKRRRRQLSAKRARKAAAGIPVRIYRFRSSSRKPFRPMTEKLPLALMSFSTAPLPALLFPPAAPSPLANDEDHPLDSHGPQSHSVPDVSLVLNATEPQPATPSGSELSLALQSFATSRDGSVDAAAVSALQPLTNQTADEGPPVVQRKTGRPRKTRPRAGAAKRRPSRRRKEAHDEGLMGEEDDVGTDVDEVDEGEWVLDTGSLPLPEESPRRFFRRSNEYYQQSNRDYVDELQPMLRFERRLVAMESELLRPPTLDEVLAAEGIEREEFERMKGRFNEAEVGLPLNNMGLLLNEASRVLVTSRDDTVLWDLAHFGLDTLREAARRFDPDRNTTYMTYAFYDMKKAMLRGGQELFCKVTLSAQGWNSLLKLNRARKRLSASLGREPTPHELSEATDLSLTVISRLAKLNDAALASSTLVQQYHDRDDSYLTRLDQKIASLQAGNTPVRSRSDPLSEDTMVDSSDWWREGGGGWGDRSSRLLGEAIERRREADEERVATETRANITHCCKLLLGDELAKVMVLRWGFDQGLPRLLREVGVLCHRSKEWCRQTVEEAFAIIDGRRLPHGVDSRHDLTPEMWKAREYLNSLGWFNQASLREIVERTRGKTGTPGGCWNRERGSIKREDAADGGGGAQGPPVIDVWRGIGLEAVGSDKDGDGGGEKRKGSQRQKKDAPGEAVLSLDKLLA